MTEPNTEICFVNVDSYEYKVIYSPLMFGGHISHFEIFHIENGEESKNPTPLTETGYRSHFFPPSIIHAYDNVKDAAIAAIKSQQNLPKFKKDEALRKAQEVENAQMCLF